MPTFLYGPTSSQKRYTTEDADLSVRPNEFTERVYSSRCPPFCTAQQVHRNSIQQQMPTFLYGPTSSQKLYTTEDAHLYVRPNELTETAYYRRCPPVCTAQQVHRNGILQKMSTFLYGTTSSQKRHTTEDAHLSVQPNEFTESVYN